jgi:hypothetical protein
VTGNLHQSAVPMTLKFWNHCWIRHPEFMWTMPEYFLSSVIGMRQREEL